MLGLLVSFQIDRSVGHKVTHVAGEDEPGVGSFQMVLQGRRVVANIVAGRAWELNAQMDVELVIL